MTKQQDLRVKKRIIKTRRHDRKKHIDRKRLRIGRETVRWK